MTWARTQRRGLAGLSSLAWGLVGGLPPRLWGTLHGGWGTLQGLTGRESGCGHRRRPSEGPRPGLTTPAGRAIRGRRQPSSPHAGINRMVGSHWGAALVLTPFRGRRVLGESRAGPIEPRGLRPVPWVQAEPVARRHARSVFPLRSAGQRPVTDTLKWSCAIKKL